MSWGRKRGDPKYRRNLIPPSLVKKPGRKTVDDINGFRTYEERLNTDDYGNTYIPEVDIGDIDWKRR